jgi:hypothetical protein
MNIPLAITALSLNVFAIIFISGFLVISIKQKHSNWYIHLLLILMNVLLMIPNAIRLIEHYNK